MKNSEFKTYMQAVSNRRMFEEVVQNDAYYFMHLTERQLQIVGKFILENYGYEETVRGVLLPNGLELKFKI